MSKAKTVIYDDEVQGHISNALTEAYELAKRSYGPKAGISMIELPYGAPLASRDGVTNLRKLNLEDAFDNMMLETIKQAADQNNRKVGDGTTAVTILTYHLYREARKLLAAGYNRMDVAHWLNEDSGLVLEQLAAMSVAADEKLVRHVASISAGDEAIGQMIADIISEVGIEGGVTVEDYKGLGIYPEVVDGFYFNKGYTSVNLINDQANLESHHQDVAIFITEKRLATVPDIGPILEKIVAAGVKDLVIIGEVEGEALGVLLVNRMKGIIATTVIDAPVSSGSRSLFLDDLAILTGGKVFLPGANPDTFTPDFLGAAAKVEVTSYSTAIVGADGAEEDVEVRLAEMREQLKTATVESDIKAIQERMARLTGKIAIIRVGGATPTEQQEVKLRVQDAVCAVQAAIKGGISPGGGVALASLVDLRFEDAYKQPFKQLASNAGLNSEALLAKVNESKNPWHGFNFKEDDPKLTNLLKAGVVDPTMVLTEVVTNSTSIVSKLITANSAMTYIDRDNKHD